MGTVDPTREQLTAFIGAQIDGPVHMLNLLRFRDVADYTDAPDLAPDGQISGRAAYDRYAEEVQPLLERVEAEVALLGETAPPVIGPDEETWDLALVVRYPKRDAFVRMVTSADYAALAGHRTAAVADSRLIPIVGADAPAD